MNLTSFSSTSAELESVNNTMLRRCSWYMTCETISRERSTINELYLAIFYTCFVVACFCCMHMTLDTLILIPSRVTLITSVVFVTVDDFDTVVAGQQNGTSFQEQTGSWVYRIRGKLQNSRAGWLLKHHSYTAQSFSLKAIM